MKAQAIELNDLKNNLDKKLNENAKDKDYQMQDYLAKMEDLKR